MAAKQQATHYHCDTIPAPQNLTINNRHLDSQRRSLSPAIKALSIDGDSGSSAFDVVTQDELLNTTSPMSLDPTTQPPWSDQGTAGETTEPDNSASRERKLCVRHLRMADEGTLHQLQKSLDELPLPDRQAVNMIWTTFSSSSHPRRATILQGLLTMCCFSQLSYLTEQLSLLIRLDPFSVLPKEVSLKVLGNLDAFSLCRAAQVSKSWSVLANDDVLWRDICAQHIGHTCRKCGWGLPLMEKKRNLPRNPSSGLLSSMPNRSPNSPKRELEAPSSHPSRPSKRQRSDILLSMPETSTTPSRQLTLPLVPVSDELLPGPSSIPPARTRPWKSVYYERLTIERNWRRGRSTVRTLKGHADGVMCMQFSENLAHPSFPVLITGSYDRTARVWNLDTGTEIAVLHGHGRAVRALQFDNAKLITGSMDRTLKVWNWRTGVCIRTLEGHTEGVVCLNFDSNILASGSVDTTVKIWNFRTGECFTLRGHHDWVNSLQLWDSRSSSTSSLVDANPDEACQPEIDPGKMLFSASDDGSIKLWDLTERLCVRTFTGHVGQVQSIKLLNVDCDESNFKEELPSPERSRSRGRDGRTTPTIPSNAAKDSILSLNNTSLNHFGSGESNVASLDPHLHREASYGDGSMLGLRNKAGPKPVLISGSLDNTIKIWDIESGSETRTLFGHIEGIWSVACSPLRIVSASHDRTIKVWSLEEGKCTATLVGHRSPVTCLCLGDDKIVSGSDDGDIRIWSFSA